MIAKFHTHEDGLMEKLKEPGAESALQEGCRYASLVAGRQCLQGLESKKLIDTKAKTPR